MIVCSPTACMPSCHNLAVSSSLASSKINAFHKSPLLLSEVWENAGMNGHLATIAVCRLDMTYCLPGIRCAGQNAFSLTGVPGCGFSEEALSGTGGKKEKETRNQYRWPRLNHGTFSILTLMDFIIEGQRRRTVGADDKHYYWDLGKYGKAVLKL